MLFHALDYHQVVGHRVQQKKKIWKTFRMLLWTIYQQLMNLLKKVKHVTWKLQEMPTLSGVSHNRAIKAVEKTGFSCSKTMKTCNDDKWRTNLDHSVGKSYQRLYYG